MSYSSRASRIVVYGLLLGALIGCANEALSETQNRELDAEQVMGGGEVVLTWEAPTRRADQSCISELEGFLIRWGESADNLEQSLRVPLEEASCQGTGQDTPCGEIQQCTYTLQGLQPGDWFFAVQAYDREFRLSAPSQTVQKTIEEEN